SSSSVLRRWIRSWTNSVTNGRPNVRRSASRLMESIAVAGSMAQRAGYGGHAWALLQYLLGFRSLGYDVVFIDFLSRDMATDLRHPLDHDPATGASGLVARCLWR